VAAALIGVMKMKIISVVALIVLGWSAAASAGPFEKTRDGGLRHKASGVVFPARVGLFQSSWPRTYDRKGDDVGVRYHLDQLIIADLYAYPAGSSRSAFDKEFANQQNAIRQLNKNVRLISQSVVSTRQGGRVVPGRQATYDLERPLFGNPRVKAGSQFLLFHDGPWFVAYRFSYPRERSAIASKHVANFLAQWSWRDSSTPKNYAQQSR
jgi:hypothetical protein